MAKEISCSNIWFATFCGLPALYISEFTLIGSWTAIHNYMNDNSEKALDRANKVIIF